MDTKTKTIVAATMAALAVPGTALATDPDRHGDGDRGKAESRSDRSGDRHEQGDRRKGKGDDQGRRGHGWVRHGRKAFVIHGVDASGLSVTDGKLAGPITLDPKAASRAARKLLGLTKEKIAGEDTVTFGAAGDAVAVKLRDVASADAVAPTDRVTVVGKVRDGRLDVRYLLVHRPSAADAAKADRAKHKRR